MQLAQQREEELRTGQIRPPEVPCDFRFGGEAGEVLCGVVEALLIGGATTSLRWDGVLLLELSLTSGVDRRCLYRRIKLDDPEAVLLLVVIPPQSSSFSWVASPLCHFLEPKQPIPPHHSTGRPCHRYHCRRTAPSIRLSCARCGHKGRGLASDAAVAERFRAHRMGGNVASGGFYECRRCN